MIFTVPWRCMLIILLLAFLQSLAQGEGWGPGDANSRSHCRATPVAGALTEGLWAAKAIPITLCLLTGFISHRSAAVNVGHPSTPRWDSQVCWKQRWINLPVAGMMLSAHKCHSQWYTQRHRETPCIQRYQNNNLCSNHWNPISFPPSSSSSHPHCSWKLSSGTSRVFPLYIQKHL